MRKFISVAVVLSLLTGCASQATLGALSSAQQACITGNQEACTAVPTIQAQANVEAQINGNTAAQVGLALILLPLLVFAAGGR